MVSSKLTPRRGTARKPPICISKPPIIPPPPPGNKECWIVPSEREQGPYTWDFYDIGACDNTLSHEITVPVEVTASGGELDPPPTEVQNCGADEPVGWTAPGQEGIYTITADFTWPDEGTCQAIATITVPGEGPMKSQTTPPPTQGPHCKPA